MTQDARLDPYRKKRNFDRSPEPSGEDDGEPEADSEAGERAFVIQKHDASTLHYDLRLEVGGVLKSWAIPKGPSTDPSEKRLAVPTEDHPLEYADFEGVIPEGEYGSGTVVVWDRGSYRSLREEKEDDGASMEESLEEGKIEIWLEGEKLRGGFGLVRFREDEEEAWLLVKMSDDEADEDRDPVSAEPRSVLSDRTVEEIAEEEDW